MIIGLGKTELADVSLKCMCTLLVELTHFNFRTNVISCIVDHLSRRSWDEASFFHCFLRVYSDDLMFACGQESELCHTSLVKVFQGDATGAVSLEIVGLLNRMIKESKYRVNPNVLSCLLHLRLKTEIGLRASNTSAKRQSAEMKGKEKRSKGTPGAQVHLSKKAKKVLKEKETIRKEMKEAEVEVDNEERDKTVGEHRGEFPYTKAFSLAHSHFEARLRSLLPNPQEPVSDTTSTRCVTRNRQILTPSQH